MRVCSKLYESLKLKISGPFLGAIEMTHWLKMSDYTDRHVSEVCHRRESDTMVPAKIKTSRIFVS